MVFAVTRWRLVITKKGEVQMRLPLHEGQYLLGPGVEAELRLLDLAGTLIVDADSVTLESDGKREAIDRSPWTQGEHVVTAERTAVSSGRTRSMADDRAAPSTSVTLVANGKRHALSKGELRIGSDEDCNIVLDSGYVSQIHATVFHKDGRVFVRDLSSKNGTYLNDVRIVEAELSPPAVLRIGDVTIDVRGDDDKRELAPYIIGKSALMRELLGDIERYANKRASVLVMGETGTGKELVARALHEESDRRDKPFIVVNCGAVASDTLESELFGHARGFAGGADKRDGAFVQAQDGTLFLDEIGDLPATVQASLLRAIESGTIKPLGEDKVKRVDVRIVATTQKNLPEVVRRGGFREDLFHRLNALSLELPALRAREGDLPLLCEHFLHELRPEGRALRLAPDAVTAVAQHPFLGNVRELRNAISRGILEAGPSGVITAKDLGLGQTRPVQKPVIALQQTERDAIINAIRGARGSRLAAARTLGIARSTLYRKLDEHAITEAEIAGINR